ncbi:MAG TPA: hypothetical protein VJJ47_02135 [Candidatus Paceibacterota bacterium]
MRELPGQTAFHWSALRKRRRARRSRWLIKWTALIVLLYGSLWYLVREDAFAVESIHISGNTVASVSAIEAVARGALASPLWSLRSGTNVYLAPRGRVGDAVKTAFPEVADVTVGREGKDLAVSISERGRWGYWCRPSTSSEQAAAEEECFALDGSGEIFAAERAPTDSVRLHGLVSGEPVRARYGDSVTFASLRALVEGLRNLGLRPATIASEENLNFRVTLAEGPYLLIDAANDGAKTAQNLALALGNGGLAKISGLEYADLRLERKVFLKWSPVVAAEE